jgi:predicted Holliday junction resolvase-like endonuclease
MNIELILIIILTVFVFILLGVALHLARTIEQLRQYISELERDYRIANKKLSKRNDSTTDHQ